MRSISLIIIRISVTIILLFSNTLMAKEINVKFKISSQDKTHIIRKIFDKMRKNYKYMYKFNYYKNVFFNFYSLDGKHKFAFIYINNRDECGTAGCSMEIFENNHKNWNLVLNTSIILDEYGENGSNLYILDKTDHGYHRLLQDDRVDGIYHYCWKDGRYRDDSKIDEPSDWVSPCPNK